MRQLVIAIVVGLGVGLAVFLIAGRSSTEAPTSPPPTLAPKAPDTDAPREKFAELWVAPTQPGLVVDVAAENRPLPGVSVQLFRDEFDFVRSERVWSRAGTENTGPEGFATFPAASGHYLALAASGDAQGTLEFDIARSAAPTRVKLNLTALRTLEGLVKKVDSNDPIPNARVRIDAGKRASVTLATVVSDAFGRFSARVPVGDFYFLEASAPNFVTGSETFSATGKHVIELTPGAVVEGLVVAPDGTPVGDVTVRAAPLGASTVSDANGNFSFTVTPGAVSLHAVALDGRQALERLRAPGRVTLKLRAGSDVLSGVVVGERITAADVRVLAEPDDLEVAHLTTGPDGRFDAKGLPPGRYSVRAQQGPGRRGSVIGIELPGAAPVEVRLSGSSQLTGMVTNGDLVPVDGATVTLSWSSGMNEIERTARTGEDGRFEFDELLSAEVSVQARLGELVSSEMPVYLAPETTAEQNLVLAQQGRMVGTVDPPNADAVMVRGPQFSERVKVVNGRFELLLPPGLYRTFISPDSPGEHVWVESEQVEVKGGEITTVSLSNQAGTDGGFKFAFAHPELGSGMSFENSNGGVRVDFLMNDCPAAKAGVVIGDMITTIDGSPAKDALDAFARVRKPNGEQLALGVRRDGRDLLLTVR
ncbi:MAG: carboxypeptidase regulatory-like domain-containing protein [Archangium sp.]